jgi:hypothetical protein
MQEHGGPLANTTAERCGEEVGVVPDRAGQEVGQARGRTVVIVEEVDPRVEILDRGSGPVARLVVGSVELLGAVDAIDGLLRAAAERLSAARVADVAERLEPYRVTRVPGGRG